MSLLDADLAARKDIAITRFRANPTYAKMAVLFQHMASKDVMDMLADVYEIAFIEGCASGVESVKNELVRSRKCP